jgi:hypothetical protein
MNREQAKTIYVAAGGQAQHHKTEWNEIHKEMEKIVAARTDRGAGLTILWWGCWDARYTATAFARRVRDAYRQMR